MTSDVERILLVIADSSRYYKCTAQAANGN